MRRILLITLFVSTLLVGSGVTPAAAVIRPRAGPALASSPRKWPGPTRFTPWGEPL